jgi:hypothetical protein
LLAGRRAFVQCGGFPIGFTSLNDLGVTFVARKMMAEQPMLIAAIRQCLRGLSGDREVHVLGWQTLASEVENLRKLERAFGVPPKAAATWPIAA